MLAILIENSIFISLFKKLYTAYFIIKRFLNRVYKESYIYKLLFRLVINLKVYLKLSFLGKITKLKERDNSKILDKSAVLQWQITAYNKRKQKVLFYLNNSKAQYFGEQIREVFFLAPLKTIGIIIIAAVLTNIIFSILFEKEIVLWGWIIRILLLFVATIGLNSRADWPTLKRRSVVLRLFSREKCAESAGK